MTDRQRVWLACAVAFVGAFAIYLAGAAPGLLFGDSGEMQGLGALGGIAHPTGYPLFVLVARVFTLVAPGPLPFRVTMVSAFWAAATVALLVRVLASRGVSTTAAFAGAMILGASFTFWTTAQRAEVYSLAEFVALLGLWRTLAALDTGRDRDRLLAGALLGLTMCGHWAFALPVAACGLTLAWDAARRPGPRVARLTALLLAFVIGTAPYAYVLWVQSHPHAFDYLRLVDDATHPTGPAPPGFDTPFGRLRWLLLGRNDLPAISISFKNERWLASNVSDVLCLLALFELGPVAAALAAAGALHQRAAHARDFALLAACWCLSLLFSVLVGSSFMLAIFMIPCFLFTAWWIAWGLDALLGRLLAWKLPLPLAAVVVLLLPIVSTVLAGRLRLYAYDHPVGPMHSSVHEEDVIRVTTLIPSMRHFDAADRFVTAALPAIPESALVISQWPELMPIKYARYVEGRRPDLTFLPIRIPNTLAALALWQRTHDLARRPIVALNAYPVLAPYVSGADTLTLAEGTRLVLIRTPQPGFEVSGAK